LENAILALSGDHVGWTPFVVIVTGWAVVPSAAAT
jgi:hypothetical protein